MKFMVLRSSTQRVRVLLFCGAMLYFFANVQRVSIPGAVFDLLQRKLSVSAAYITALGAVFMYVYAAAQLFVGLLVDRYGGVRTILAGGIVFCTGALLFPFCTGLPMLYLARALTGLGAGTLYLSLIKETIRFFPRNYGVMISVVIMIGYAGGIAANAPFSASAGRFGLTATSAGVGVLALLFYGGFYWVARRLKTAPVSPVSLHPGRYRIVWRDSHNRALFLFSGMNWGLYYVIQTVIGKKFLEDYCRMQPGHAAWVLSAMSLLSALAGFSFALLSKHFDNRRQIFCRSAGWMCAVGFSFLSILIVLDIRSPFAALFFCLLATTASISSITIPLLRETNSEELTGSAIALMNFSFYLAVAVLGSAAGFLLDSVPPELHGDVEVYSRGSWLALFLPLNLCAWMVLFFSLKMRETFGRPQVTQTLQMTLSRSIK